MNIRFLHFFSIITCFLFAFPLTVSADGGSVSIPPKLVVASNHAVDFDWSRGVITGHSRKLFRTDANGTVVIQEKSQIFSDVSRTFTFADGQLGVAYSNYILKHDAVSGKPLQALFMLFDGSTIVDVARDGDLLYVLTKRSNGTQFDIRLFNQTTGMFIKELRRHENIVHDWANVTIKSQSYFDGIKFNRLSVQGAKLAVAFEFRDRTHIMTYTLAADKQSVELFPRYGAARVQTVEISPESLFSAVHDIAFGPDGKLYVVYAAAESLYSARDEVVRLLGIGDIASSIYPDPGYSLKLSAAPYLASSSANILERTLKFDLAGNMFVSVEQQRGSYYFYSGTIERFSRSSGYTVADASNTYWAQLKDFEPVWR